jgi:hypothetical protein
MNYTDTVKTLPLPTAENGGTNQQPFVTLPTLRDAQSLRGTDIRLRLLPDFATNPASLAPFTHHFHGVISAATGKYAAITCPPACPVCQHGREEWRRTNKRPAWSHQMEHLINAYVLDNPINSTQNRTVKVLKFRQQIKAILDEALTGRDATEIGRRLFFLDDGGRTFVIHAERKGDWPVYDRSFIDTATRSKLDVADLSRADMEAIYAQSRPLADIFPPATPEEAETWFQTHVLGQGLPADPPDAPMPF